MTGGALEAAGVEVRYLDLNAVFADDVLPLAPFRDPTIYADPERHHAAVKDVDAAAARIAADYRVEYTLRRLVFPDIDEGHVPSALKVGLNVRRNPAMPTLFRAAEGLVRDPPRVVAIAMVHPEAMVQSIVFARLLRQLGYTGVVVLYGSLEDHVAPADIAPDLLGDHVLWRDLDAIVVGEGETALAALARGDAEVPNLLRKGDTRLPERVTETLSTLATPSFGWARDVPYPYPTPVVDLRIGRGCPWGKCAFCGIHVHHPGFRATPTQRLTATLQAAHDALGSTWFRVRDDLVTPVQLAQLGDMADALSFQPHLSARSRFEPTLSFDALVASGLEEIWFGLESAVPRVRELMGKGVDQDTIERLLDDTVRAGIRTRLLCIVGFPGETSAELAQTVDFLTSNAERYTTASLTSFQLLRTSAVAKEPWRYGLQVRPDPVRRSERLRHRVPFVPRRPDDVDVVRRAYATITDVLVPKVMAEYQPDVMHAWMASQASSGRG